MPWHKILYRCAQYCGFSVWNLLHGTFLGHRFWEKLCAVALVSNGRALMKEKLKRIEIIYLSNINRWHLERRGTAVAQWLRCCATNRKVARSAPVGVIGFFLDIKTFRSHYGPGVDSASNRNEYQERYLEVKAAGA